MSVEICIFFKLETFLVRYICIFPDIKIKSENFTYLLHWPFYNANFHEIEI